MSARTTKAILDFYHKYVTGVSPWSLDEVKDVQSTQGEDRNSSTESAHDHTFAGSLTVEGETDDAVE